MLCVKPDDNKTFTEPILKSCKIKGTEPRVLHCIENGITKGYIVVDKIGGILNIPDFCIMANPTLINLSADDKEIAEYLIRAAGSYGLNRYILALETENKSFYNVFKQFGFAEVDNKLSIQLKVLFKKCENC